MSVLNQSQIAFAKAVAVKTGLQFDAVAAWALAEEPSTRSPEDQGYNWLNCLNKSLGRGTGFSGVPIEGWAPSGFAKFRDVNDAATEASYWINHFSNYANIRATVGKTANVQIVAIAESPWDAGHYGSTASEPAGHLVGTLATVRAAHLDGSPPKDILIVKGVHGSTLHSVVFGENRVRDFFAHWEIRKDVEGHGPLEISIKHTPA